MSEAYDRRVELAAERGFDSPYQQDRWIGFVRDEYGENLTFNEALDIAQFEMNYEPGDWDRDSLEDWWEEHVGEVDWDDPDDPFFDFLDALSGEGA